MAVSMCILWVSYNSYINKCSTLSSFKKINSWNTEYSFLFSRDGTMIGVFKEGCFGGRVVFWMLAPWIFRWFFTVGTFSSSSFSLLIIIFHGCIYLLTWGRNCLEFQHQWVNTHEVKITLKKSILSQQENLKVIAEGYGKNEFGAYIVS